MTLHDGNDFSEDIRKDLVKTVREQIGAFAAPDVIHWAPGWSKVLNLMTCQNEILDLS